MSTIATESTIFPTTAAASASTAASAAKSSIMGKEDFLTLLVAQLKNQDPLKPDDPTAFTAQLAQFSSLEQLTNLNKSMEGLTTAQANSEKLSALSLIGKDVSFNGSTFNYEGTPVGMGYQIDGTASSVTLSIQDADGKTVRTMQASPSELKAGNHFITWDGTDQNGNPVASGKYKVILQASAMGQGASIAAAPLLRSVVTGVDLASGMITTRAGEVLFSNIFAVSDPQNASTLATTNSNMTAPGTVASSTTGTTASTEQTAQDIIDQYIQQLHP